MSMAHEIPERALTDVIGCSACGASVHYDVMLERTDEPFTIIKGKVYPFKAQCPTTGKNLWARRLVASGDIVADEGQQERTDHTEANEKEEKTQAQGEKD